MDALDERNRVLMLACCFVTHFCSFLRSFGSFAEAAGNMPSFLCSIVVIDNAYVAKGIIISWPGDNRDVIGALLL